MVFFVKIQSTYVCFIFFVLCSGCKARQYWAENVLTQGEGKCQINNEGGPREAVEEAIEIRLNVLIVQLTEACTMYLQCCKLKSGSYRCLSSSISPFSPFFHCRLSNERRNTGNIFIFYNKDGSWQAVEQVGTLDGKRVPEWDKGGRDNEKTEAGGLVLQLMIIFMDHFHYYLLLNCSFTYNV